MWKIDGGLHSSQRTQRAEDTSREILALFRKQKKKKVKVQDNRASYSNSMHSFFVWGVCGEKRINEIIFSLS